MSIIDHQSIIQKLPVFPEGISNSSRFPEVVDILYNDQQPVHTLQLTIYGPLHQPDLSLNRD